MGIVTAFEQGTAPRPLLVGESNPYGSDPKYALYPYPERSAGGRLCQLIMDIRLSEYIKRFDRVNLCAGKWSVKEAREKMFELTRGPVRPIVLLGAKVSAAFGFEFVPCSISFITKGNGEHKGQSFRIAILPHPSGLCRIWNEPDAIERARKTLREVGIDV